MSPTRRTVLGSLMLIGFASTAEAMNFYVMGYHRPEIHEVVRDGKQIIQPRWQVVYVRHSEWRMGPEGSAKDDNRRWRAESFSKIAAKGVLAERGISTSISFEDEKTPTVRIRVRPPKSTETAGAASKNFSTQNLVNEAVTCILLTARANALEKVRIVVDAEDTTLFEHVVGTYPLARQPDEAAEPVDD